MILAVWCTYMKGSGNRRIRNSKRILKRGVLKHREIILWLFLLLVLVVLSVMLSGKINSLSKMKKMAAQPVSYKDEVFRCQNFGMDVISEIMQNHNYEAGVRQMFWGKQNNMLNIFNKMDGILIPENDKGRYAQALEVLYRDIRFFPVKQDARQKYGWYYEDSWGDARTYGGTRRHEGTDIMAENNRRGYFTIVSVSDGVVEKKGWLQQGGYRIGIRSPSGAYFYYAHLYDYANLQEGDSVLAGETLGHMGDTGYSEIEGTTGNFAVHLHFGMYLNMDGKETSVNSYPVLSWLEAENLVLY